MNQKRFVNIVFIVLVVILAGVVGYFTLVNKSTLTTQVKEGNKELAPIDFGTVELTVISITESEYCRGETNSFPARTDCPLDDRLPNDKGVFKVDKILDYERHRETTYSALKEGDLIDGAFYYSARPAKGETFKVQDIQEVRDSTSSLKDWPRKEGYFYIYAIDDKIILPGAKQGDRIRAKIYVSFGGMAIGEYELLK